MPEPVHLPDRIEADAQRLWFQLMTSDKDIISFTDSQEYADGVMTILEGLYPGAADRVRFEVVGRYPGTTG